MEKWKLMLCVEAQTLLQRLVTSLLQPASPDLNLAATANQRCNHAATRGTTSPTFFQRDIGVPTVLLKSTYNEGS